MHKYLHWLFLDTYAPKNCVALKCPSKIHLDTQCPPPDSDSPAFILYRKEGSSSQELGIFIANVDCVKSFSKLNSILATHTSENAIYVSLSNIGCRADGGAQMAKIAEKVHKPPL